jgi:hypothetical protein
VRDGECETEAATAAAQAAAAQAEAENGAHGERAFQELCDLGVASGDDRANFYVDGVWDVGSLVEDLAAAKASAGVAAARAPQGEEEEEEEEEEQQQQQQEEEEQQQQQQRQEGDDRQEGDPCWWPDGPAVQQATANSGTIWRRGQPPDFKDMPVSHEYFKDDWSNMVHAPLPPSLFIRFPSCATSPRV